MRFGTAVVAATVTLSLTSGVAHAQTDPTGAPSGAHPALHGIDKDLVYQVRATDDRRAVETILEAGSFRLERDAKVVAVLDKSGAVVAALPTVVRLGDQVAPIVPTIDATGTRLTLTPVSTVTEPLRDISAQERFFAETQRLAPQIAGGAAIGAVIGFVLGFPLGLFVLDFITVPVTTVVGAAVGALFGYAVGGGQPAIDAALAYVTGAP